MVGGTSAGTFEQRMQELKQLVGPGKISGITTFDQRYARIQHNNVTYQHPRGGKAFYLRDATTRHQRETLGRIAQEVFRGNTQALMISYVNQVERTASGDAPIELGNLRNSGSVGVKVNSGWIYRKAAKKARMTRAELNSRVRLSGYGAKRRA
jgi:hypothetical protein